MILKVVFESAEIRKAYQDGEKKFAWESGNSGIDLRSSEPTLVLSPGETRVISSGLRLQISDTENDLYEIVVRPRSGISSKGILKQIGTIDFNYTGVIGIGLTNLSGAPFTIEFGDRIAQAVVQKIEKPQIQITESLTETNRGDNGFGSSGIR